jgi:quercetin dioxygenase-like cupin family protein
VRCTRIVSEDGGPSRFEDVDVELEDAGYAPPAPPFRVSEPVPSTAMLLATLPMGYESDWHPSPARQWFLQLSGELEVQTGDGEVRRLRPGTAVLVEDVTGPGHRTRVVGEVPVRGAFVRLAS